jgi:hypothetical protein
VGDRLGFAVGLAVGLAVGGRLGLTVGDRLGLADGLAMTGLPLGRSEGVNVVGALLGFANMPPANSGLVVEVAVGVAL